MKNVSQRVDNVFQRLIQMLHKTWKTKDNMSPRCNKAQNIVNTRNRALFTSNIMLNIKRVGKGLPTHWQRFENAF